jgi:YidC/Oxa1 family membrane protein insertase
LFIQMPVIIGLFRCLAIDIELRDAPLLSHAVRWCSNLAAPDMLYDWHGFMPAWFNEGGSIFALGPYFNLLPVLGAALMFLQMKVSTPKPADEQAAMQQKMMQYMMLFMGLMFFKWASGLCIYFIVTTVWSFGERRFLPKAPPAANSGPETRAQAKARLRKTPK